MLYIKQKILFILLFVASGYTLGQGIHISPKDGFVFDITDIQLEWNTDSGVNIYHLQIANDVSFNSLLIDENNINTPYFLAQGLPSNSHYYWRVKVDNGNWSSPTSFKIIDYNTWSDLKVWLKPDSVEAGANDYISTWYDYKGNHDFVMPSSSRQPKFINNLKELNNYNVIEFPSEERTYLSSSGFSSFSAGDIFSLMKVDKAVPTNAAFSGLWSFGRSPNEDYYPYTDGAIYADWGRSESFVINNIPTAIKLDDFHILNISTGIDFNFRINKNLLLNESTGITNFKNGATIGKSRGNAYFNGLIAEVLIFSTVLNDSLRDLTHDYFRYKYAPPVNIGKNISYSLCDSILYAGKHFNSYLWSDGSINDSLIINTTGKYWVEVEDIFGNISSDTIEFKTKKFEYPNQRSFCHGDSIVWYTNLNSNYTFLWADGSTADSLIINSTGDISVIVTDKYGCVFKSDTLSFFRDDFEITATLGPDTTMCSGNSLGLTTGASKATNYLWNTGETTPEITINTSGTYSVIVQNTNGCEAKDTIIVTIQGDAPVIQTQLPNITCVGAPFDFQDNSTTTDGSTIIGWDWDFGDGNSATVKKGSHAYSSSGIYDIELTVETSAGCFNQETFSIEVKESPVLTFATTNQCQNEEIQFNGGQMSPTTINNWEWNFDDPGSGGDNIGNGQNPSHTFSDHGDYEVMLIGTDIFGCVDTLVQTKTIEPTPVADFTLTEVCEGSIVNFKNTSTVAPPSTISSYQWSLGDGTQSNQRDPQKPYGLYGNYTVELTTTANNGCSHTTSRDIKIHATPQVHHEIDQACAGLETSFKDASFVPDGSVAEVDWKFDSQAAINGFNITKKFASSGVYSMEQTVKSGFGCINSQTSNITINPYLNADFTFTPNAFITGYPIAFKSTSSGENEYLWNFGNIANSTQADTTIIFDDSLIGTEQIVKLRVGNQWGCSDSISVKGFVLKQRTDLEISQLFSQDINGFLTIGVRLKNKGSTPISKVDLVLNSPSTGFIKETWKGVLQANEEEIYIFSANPSAKISAEDTLQNFLCIEGSIVQPVQFKEEDFSNNEVCKTMTDNQAVIVQPYPNPVKEGLTVKVVMPKKEVIALRIYDSFGKLVHVITEKQKLEKGLTVFVLDTSAWSNGRYNIVFEGEEEVPVVGFVKL